MFSTQMPHIRGSIYSGVIGVSTQMPHIRGSIAGVLTLLHRCHPYAVLLWCYPLFYIDTTPTRFYGAGTYIFYIDATPTRFCYGVIGVSTQMPPLRGSVMVPMVSTQMPHIRGLTFVWLRFYTDVAPLGLDFCVGYVSTEMSPLRGWVCGRRGVSTQMLKKYAEIRRNTQKRPSKYPKQKHPTGLDVRGWQ